MVAAAVKEGDEGMGWRAAELSSIAAAVAAIVCLRDMIDARLYYYGLM